MVDTWDRSIGYIAWDIFFPCVARYSEYRINNLLCPIFHRCHRTLRASRLLLATFESVVEKPVKRALTHFIGKSIKLEIHQSWNHGIATSWIEVTIEGVLKAADECGVLLEYVCLHEHPLERPRHTHTVNIEFFPWHMISRVKLSEIKREED